MLQRSIGRYLIDLISTSFFNKVYARLKFIGAPGILAIRWVVISNGARCNRHGLAGSTAHFNAGAYRRVTNRLPLIQGGDVVLLAVRTIDYPVGIGAS